MALTIVEQLRLLSGDLSPDSTDLGNLVKQCSFKYAKQFYDTLKDTTDNDDATSYANKMIGICKQVFKSNEGLNHNIKRIVVLIIGEVATNVAQVEAANDAAWETFVYSQMDEAFEYLSDVRSNEKTAYQNI